MGWLEQCNCVSLEATLFVFEFSYYLVLRFIRGEQTHDPRCMN